MQTVSFGDNLYEMSKPFFLEGKKNIVHLSSEAIAQRVVMVKEDVYLNTLLT